MIFYTIYLFHFNILTFIFCSYFMLLFDYIIIFCCIRIHPQLFHTNILSPYWNKILFYCYAVFYSTNILGCCHMLIIWPNACWYQGWQTGFGQELQRVPLNTHACSWCLIGLCLLMVAVHAEGYVPDNPLTTGDYGNGIGIFLLVTSPRAWSICSQRSPGTVMVYDVSRPASQMTQWPRRQR